MKMCVLRLAVQEEWVQSCCSWYIDIKLPSDIVYYYLPLFMATFFNKQQNLLLHLSLIFTIIIITVFILFHLTNYFSEYKPECRHVFYVVP